VIEDRDPQVVHRSLTGELKHGVLDIRRHVLRDDQPDEQQGVEWKRIDVAAENMVLERVGDEIGLRELEGDRHAHEEAPRDEQHHVRPDVLPDASDQPDVICLAEDRFGLDTCALRRRCDGHQLAS
jgi:hypothetical protein